MTRRGTTLGRALAQARHLLPQAKAELAAYPNVVAVGVGLRRKDDVVVRQACFVVEVSEKIEALEKPLPPQCLGVPVDVQPRGALQFRAGPASSIERIGSDEVGRTGLIAADDDGNAYAFTAMHVIDRDVIPTFTQHPNPPVRVRLGSDAASVEGNLVYGMLDEQRDLACVKLDAGSAPSADVGDTGFAFTEPTPLYSALVGTRIGLVVAKDRVYTGTLLAYPVDETVRTDLGERQTFRGLAKFELRDAVGALVAIQEGWSGSAIYVRESFAPVLLLSLADASGFWGYGYPIYPAMRAGKLRIWQG